MKCFVALLAASLPLAAQFQQLTTDDSGSRVWFSTSLRIRGSDQHQRDKIFSADAEGRVTLVAQRPVDNPYHLLTAPEVSGDGRVLAYSTGFACVPEQTCRGGESRSALAVDAVETQLSGAIRISRNGRYVLRSGYPFNGPTAQVEIIDRVTNTTRPIAVADPLTLSGARLVTPGGTALVYSSGSLWLLRFDGTFQQVQTRIALLPIGVLTGIPARFGVSSALRASMDDAASVIVYESGETAPALLVARSTTQYEARDLVRVRQGATNPVLSADGKRVLFLSRANWSGRNSAGLQQAWTVGTDTGEIQAAANDPAGIAEAILSADGNVVWAATFAGRLVRVNLRDGSVREVIPRTTVVDQDGLVFPSRVAAGSLARLTGRGLAAQYAGSGVPLATELSGVQLLGNGVPLPLHSISPAEIRFQVPWELRGPLTLSLAPSRSPFEDRLIRSASVLETQVGFEYIGDVPAVAHGDFRGLITENDPIRAGEVIHVFVTGLGPVAPAVRTGEPSPNAPLSPASNRIFASWIGLTQGSSGAAELLFAGLAPGTVGVYQVSVRVPQILPVGIRIQAGDSSAGVFFFSIIATIVPIFPPIFP